MRNKPFRSLLNAEEPFPIIERVCVYRGPFHRWAKGLRVSITRVHRLDQEGEYQILCTDGAIGALRESDIIEFFPQIEEDGRLRWSWITSDARPGDLEPLKPMDEAESSQGTPIAEGIVLDIDNNWFY